MITERWIATYDKKTSGGENIDGLIIWKIKNDKIMKEKKPSIRELYNTIEWSDGRERQWKKN